VDAIAPQHDGFEPAEAEVDPDVYRRRWAILAVLCLSLVIVIIGNTSLNVAIPTLARELDASTSALQWMVDAYALVFAGLLFTAGTLGDRYGRKGALQFDEVEERLDLVYRAKTHAELAALTEDLPQPVPEPPKAASDGTDGEDGSACEGLTEARDEVLALLAGLFAVAFRLVSLERLRTEPLLLVRSILASQPKLSPALTPAAADLVSACLSSDVTARPRRNFANRTIPNARRPKLAPRATPSHAADPSGVPILRKLRKSL
jgi:hypothetical protein